MTSTSSTRRSDEPSGIFMIVPSADSYRWVGRLTDEAGQVLAKVREAPVADSWKPLPVGWVPETRHRAVCDFPIFHPVVRCFSRRALAVLEPYCNEVEFLALEGLEGGYVGVHCVSWISAADEKHIDRERIIVHSTLYVPPLLRSAVLGHHIFGVSGFIAKLFVSAAVRDKIEAAGISGAEFYPVGLT